MKIYIPEDLNSCANRFITSIVEVLNKHAHSGQVKLMLNCIKSHG